MKLSPDVAGATFMAAGSSAPELATVIIGVFFAKDDIGISGVIGSAVFNIMFVISVCALCAGTVCTLNWFPLCRDCFWYALSILVMLFVICNDLISWFESLFMLLVYVAYCVSLHFNELVEKWANTLPLPCKPASPDEEAHLVTYRTLAEDPNNPNNPNNANQQQQYPDMQTNGEGGQPVAPQGAPAAPGAPGAPGPQYYKPKEPTGEEVSPLEMPPNMNQIETLRWYSVYPIHYLCRLTMPDCRQQQYRQWYPFTFVISMVWISFYSYIMVWMITVIGSTLGIPDTVMGLTFVAAGVSVPDALSSLAVVKEGYGDMAVSNAVGSNVFDILICLGLPWFLQTAIIAPGSHVNVYSKGLTYSTLSLLSTVVFLVVATHLNGWKLDKKYGVILMLWYLAFISFASLYELNVFGDLNPPECPSTY
ncbi:probable sodium/potassium/calcium exchanger CG1090 [Thrips palmi]|uniref:Probable sodium/potassium/calcium exchanger CG1090 n=1 Tax=Thrips palmi TaxID=161013 RepID=A0A6P8ZH03_THRPL|nr:probable sodium/potassium/calcium exchanger CG1090 [Thrips palmi]